MKTIATGLLALFSACVLASCQSTNRNAPDPLASGHWKKVRDTPPTYFPRDTPRDHPTGFKDGYWVPSGDTEGTRFFIPVRNTRIPRDQLIAEAQSSMTAAAKRQLALRKGQSSIHDAAGSVVGRTSAAVLWLFKNCDPSGFNIGSFDLDCGNIGGMNFNCSGL